MSDRHRERVRRNSKLTKSLGYMTATVDGVVIPGRVGPGVVGAETQINQI